MPIHVLALIAGLALLVGLCRPARAQDDPPAPPTAEEAQQQASGLFYERCSVDPESFDGRQVGTHWEMLVVLGYDPARILELAQTLDTDCRFVSFKSAILAANNTQLRATEASDAPDGEEKKSKGNKERQERPKMKRGPRRRR